MSRRNGRAPGVGLLRGAAEQPFTDVVPNPTRGEGADPNVDVDLDDVEDDFYVVADDFYDVRDDLVDVRDDVVDVRDDVYDVEDDFYDVRDDVSNLVDKFGGKLWKSFHDWWNGVEVGAATPHPAFGHPLPASRGEGLSRRAYRVPLSPVAGRRCREALAGGPRLTP